MTGAIKDPTTIFTGKAASYNRFRWDYAPGAIAAVLNMSAVTKKSVMADIGSGTGILTRHFLDKVEVVYAVEPNQAMRRVAKIRHGAHPAFRSIARRAESTELPADSLDLVIVGQALHWFDPNCAPNEFSRILMSDGWFAVIWNNLGQGELTQALEDLFSRYMGDIRRRTDPELLPPYFQGADYQHLWFSVDRHSNWDQFIGGLLTASWAPEVNEAEYQRFVARTRTVFDQYSSDGELTIEVISNVAIGQLIAKGSS
jgi:ubiquinone/menaquinone biosynthesis C-methylase UbiE